MATTTKKEIIDRIANNTKIHRDQVRAVVTELLDVLIDEVGRGNRLEFREFGVFEVRVRAARQAQNPKTLTPVLVPEKRTVKFKAGRKMRAQLASGSSGAMVEAKPRRKGPSGQQGEVKPAASPVAAASGAHGS